MATITSTTQTLTVPAGYVDDVRVAFLSEVESQADGNPLQVSNLQDRKSNAEMLRRSMETLGALLDADGEVELTGPSDHLSSPLVHGLEAMVRQLAGRLVDAGQFAPLPMGEALDLSERIQWAAREAIRMQPAVDDRPKVTIDRVTRDALLGQLAVTIENAAQALGHARIEHDPASPAVSACRDLLGRWSPVLDALAPAVDAFELPVVDGLTDWLRDRAVPEAEGYAEDCRVHGDVPIADVEAGFTEEEAVARELERAEQAREALAALLERLDGVAAVAS